jgi:hypothetical protein
MDTNMLISKLEQLRNLVDECLNALQHKDSPQTHEAAPVIMRSLSSADVDFTTPARPFMKPFVELSGAKKFALLLAWMAKGDLDKQVPLSEVESLWSSMSGMLNVKFNRKFTSDAKDSDWVESRRTGFYNLRPNWKQVLNGRAKSAVGTA